MFGLAIHGGAGTLPRAEMSTESDALYRAGLSEALAAGFAVLERGGTSLEAVTRAVVALEDLHVDIALDQQRLLGARILEQTGGHRGDLRRRLVSDR